MCGRLRVGKEFLHVAILVRAAMCSAFDAASGPGRILALREEAPVCSVCGETAEHALVMCAQRQTIGPQDANGLIRLPHESACGRAMAQHS